MWPFKRRNKDNEPNFVHGLHDSEAAGTYTATLDLTDPIVSLGDNGQRSERHLDLEEDDPLPRFAASAVDSEIGAGSEWLTIRTLLRDVFTSSQPVLNREQLVGRRGELEQLIRAVSEQRAHAIIYGPRGYGKTSLVRTFGEIADQAGYIVVYTSCSRFTRFGEFFRFYLDEVPLRHSSRCPNFSAGSADIALSSLLPMDADVRQLADLLGTIRHTRLIFILDEYDRIEDPLVQREMAELIKDLSDLQAHVSLVLVGVARNVQDLLGFHPSIHRNLVCVPLRRLDDESARRMVTTGAARCSLKFDDEVVDAVLSLTGGSPYHLRLLCFHAGLVAASRRHHLITLPLLCEGIENVLREWAPLDPAGAAVVSQMSGDPEYSRSVEAVARACLAGNDRCTNAAAAREYVQLTDGGRSSGRLPPAGICTALARSGRVLTKILPRSASNASVYAFANHMTPQFLLMAAWRHRMSVDATHLLRAEVLH